MNICDNLKSIRNTTNLTQAMFAKKFGMTQTTYSQYETGKRAIPDEFKIELSKIGIDLHWLITGEGSMFRGEQESAPDQSPPPDVGCDSIAVPMTGMRLSAGPGEEWDEGSFTGEILQVPKKIARRYPGNSDFAGATISGDSMEPTLHDGEPVVFVRGFIKGDGIYALAVRGELLVKRLEFNQILNKLRIISDNPKYPPTEISMEELDQVQILGKVVIWVHGEI